MFKSKIADKRAKSAGKVRAGLTYFGALG